MKSVFKVCGIIALAAIIGFGVIACDVDDTSVIDNSVKIPGGKVTDKLIHVSGTTVYEWDDTDGTKPIGNEYDGFYTHEIGDDFFSPVCKITNGKLMVNLGTPLASSLYWIRNDFTTVSDDDVKWYFIYTFISAENVWLKLLNEDSDAVIYFVYVDGDVKVSGEHHGFTYDNVSLKKGWNVVVCDEDTGKAEIKKLDSGFKWIVN